MFECVIGKSRKRVHITAGSLLSWESTPYWIFVCLLHFFSFETHLTENRAYSCLTFRGHSWWGLRDSMLHGGLILDGLPAEQIPNLLCCLSDCLIHPSSLLDSCLGDPAWYNQQDLSSLSLEERSEMLNNRYLLALVSHEMPIAYSYLHISTEDQFAQEWMFWSEAITTSLHRYQDPFKTIKCPWKTDNLVPGHHSWFSESSTCDPTGIFQFLKFFGEPHYVVLRGYS